MRRSSVQERFHMAGKRRTPYRSGGHCWLRDLTRRGSEDARGGQRGLHRPERTLAEAGVILFIPH